MNGGGIIQSASDSVEALFGWTSTELLGKNVKLLIPEPRRSALDRYLDRYRHADLAATLKRTRRFDALRKDGTRIKIELAMSRADLPVHAAPFFIGIIRNVTDEIDIGQDTAAERSRLQQLILAQTRALATANLRLQLADRLAALGTLAAGLGHDMNNVLLPVRAHLNAIEHAGLGDAGKTHLKAVRRSIAYLQHLSDGLHFLAMDPDGPGTASNGSGTTELSYWWSQVGDLLRKAVPKHVKFRASLSARLPAIRVAPHWLTQAVLNLVVNAGEAIPPGSKTATVHLWAEVTSDSSRVRLGVTDTGRGMSHGVQRRALDLFFTTKPRSMGTGLGLPLAQKVAERAGGEVEITSQPGKGTTVVLVLPVAPAGTVPVTTLKSLRTAAISVRDRRAAALITQILISADVDVRAAKATGPENTDCWITTPSPKALAIAKRWRKGSARRTVVLLGMPPKSARAGWAAITPAVIDPPDDFEVMRQVLGQAISKQTTPGVII